MLSIHVAAEHGERCSVWLVCVDGMPSTAALMVLDRLRNK
jgi:hypothetical protein